MLRDLALLVVATLVLASLLRVAEAWQKEVRMHRRLNKLQQLVLSIERARGNGLDLDGMPAGVLEAIGHRVPDVGVLAVLSAGDGLSARAVSLIRTEARNQRVCVLVEGTPTEMDEFLKRSDLRDLKPTAVPLGVGGRLVSDVPVPYLVHVASSLVLRRCSLAEPAAVRQFESSGRGGAPADGERDPVVTPIETRR